MPEESPFQVIRPLRAHVRKAGSQSLGCLSLFGYLTGNDEELALGVHDFQSTFGLLVRLDGLARRLIQSDKRPVDAERYVDPVAHGDEPSRQIGRPATKTPQMPLPFRYPPFPQEHAVECVAGNKMPVGLQYHQSDRRFVYDVEDAPARRDGGGDEL